MQRLMPIFIGLFLTITPVLALQATNYDSWPVEQHCLKVQSQPPTGWTLSGKILFVGDYGVVREMQSDLHTIDFIPHDKNSFTFAASVSPDGKWLAVPRGDMEPISDIDDSYTFSDINIYDTQSGEKSYQIPWDVHWVFVPHDSPYLVPPLYWVDNTHILYATGNSTSRLGYSIVNPFTNQIQQLKTNDDHNAWYNAMSPDSTRIFTAGYGVTDVSLLDLNHNKVIGLVADVYGIIWKPDSSGFAISTRKERSVELMDRDGNPIARIANDGGFNEDQQGLWSSDGRYLSFVHTIDDYTIYLADTQESKVLDLCIDGAFYENHPVWSPKDTQLVTIIQRDGERFLLLIDLEANNAYITEQKAAFPLAWLAEK
jgi:WD40 repeat protein